MFSNARSVRGAALVALLAGLAGGGGGGGVGVCCGQEVKEEARPAVHKPQVQLAILLDTSGSMDGLIEQAKTELWSIVNALATAKQKGQRPALTVALYEYGKDSIPASEGYLRQILPLTDD